MGKRSDIELRKDRILGIVVDRYVETIEPVGSHVITEEYNLDVSPATVRNILAELEEEGYLTHPHTSAGRVPTQRGYRYYVDHLMHEIQLLEDEKHHIQQEYRRHIDQLEILMEKTSQVISDLTHYTAIISVDGNKGPKMICRGTSHVVGYSDSSDLLKIKAILRVLEAKEDLLELINRDLEKKIDIYIGHELALKEMEGCSLAVSGFQTSEMTGRIAVLGPTRMQYDRVVSTLGYISQILSRKH